VKALKFDGSLNILRDVPVPRREGEALVQVICAGICNTDLEIAKGYANFRGTPGHEFVGRVVESPVGSLLDRRVVGEINAGCGVCELCFQGDPRHCVARTVLGIKGREGAFAEFLSLPVRNLIEVPASITDESAVFVEPLAAALNILEQLNIDSTTDVALLGDGKLALLIVLAMARSGCTLTVIGKHKSKLAIAEQFGADSVLLDTFSAFRGRKFDVVIDATGSPAGLSTSLELVKPRGTVVLKSTHHGAVSLEMSQVVVNEVKIVGSRCGRFLPAIQMLAEGKVDLRSLISYRLPLDDGVHAFHQAAAPGVMKVILQIS
jgi:2-desacetyl-2-hydroxyethyl bacteriochlorophyllide A dehydrogenase